MTRALNNLGGGLPLPSDESVAGTMLDALEMQAFISERIISKRSKNEVPFEKRLGIHTSPVVAGIVGLKKFQYNNLVKYSQYRFTNGK